MKKKKPESKLITQNHLNDYDERFHCDYLTSECEMCCCHSCTGFGCPWVTRGKFESNGNRYRANRCEICRRNDFKKIFDCDYYSYYRRRKFFVPKKLKRKKSQLELVNEKLDLILKLLEKSDEK